MDIVLTLALLLGVPMLLKITENTKIVMAISPIALAYAAGIGLAAGIGFSFVSIPLTQAALQQTTYISIALSISLLVLSSNLDKFRILLKPVLKAFFLGILTRKIHLNFGQIS